MARGNKKSTALKVNTREEDYSGFEDGQRYSVLDFNGKDKDLIEEVRQLVVAKTQRTKPDEPEAFPYNMPYKVAYFKEGGEKFLELVGEYNGNAPQNRSRAEQKELKEKLVAAYEELPPKLKALVSMPDSFIDKLYRGSTHPTNPGPDGKVNASFTTIKKHADFFVMASKVNMEYSEKVYPPDQSKVYTSKDIKSFGKIIDITKAAKIRRILEYLRREKEFKSGESEPRYSLGYNDESEYMVTDINWKK